MDIVVTQNYTYETNLFHNEFQISQNGKEKFLSGISHKLKTPLNAIMGYTELLLEENLSDTVREKAQNIYQSSADLLTVINGLLDISAIENGDVKLENVSYQIKDLKKFIISYLKGNVDQNNIAIHYEEEGNIPYLLSGDFEHIKQILLYICNNAIKFTKVGFIKMKISGFTKNDTCKLRISIEDSGIGIPSEKQPFIFSKFERIGTEDEVNNDGIGLGLVMSKKLIELMNGTISFESVYQRGSIFTLTFEQKIIKKEEDIEILEVDDNSYRGKKILLVDDNQMNLKVEMLLLKKYNVNIEMVNSGSDAIKKIEEGNHYDLIFMDDMMPNMTGREAMHILKDQKNYKGPILACTANAMEGMREEYLTEGFDEYLEKPIIKKELERVLALYLKK